MYYGTIITIQRCKFTAATLCPNSSNMDTMSHKGDTENNNNHSNNYNSFDLQDKNSESNSRNNVFTIIKD